jgi:zinc D-Ala-D-Ala carboxypeptidase
VVDPLDAPTLNGGVYVPATSVSAAAGIGAYNAAASLGAAPGVASGSATSTTTDPSATPTGASAGKVGGYGGMDVPVELRQYQNGQLPDSVLEPIGQGSHRLWGPAAESWKGAIAAAAADGIDLKITDSYRTYAEQVDLAKRKGLYQNGGLAAVPGTSNHGWGLAVDVNIDNPQVLDWLHTNGWKFGFVEAVKREPWHWEYRPSQA